MISAKAPLLLLLISSAACRPPEIIWKGQDTLTSQGFVITPQRPVKATGPTHEVCITSDIGGVMFDRDSRSVPGHPGIHIDIHLIRPDGSRDRLGYNIDTAIVWREPGPNRIIVYPDNMPVIPKGYWDTVISRPTPPSMHTEGKDVICVWSHEWDEPDPHSVYRAIELRTDRPLPIQEVRWWSGQRRAWS